VGDCSCVFKNITADRYAVTFKTVLVHIKQTEHIFKFHITVYKELALADFVVVMLNFLVLVPYFADNFFEQILHCNNTECSAVFIRNDRKMNFCAFECIKDF